MGRKVYFSNTKTRWHSSTNIFSEKILYILYQKLREVSIGLLCEQIAFKKVVVSATCPFVIARSLCTFLKNSFLRNHFLHASTNAMDLPLSHDNSRYRLSLTQTSRIAFAKTAYRVGHDHIFETHSNTACSLLHRCQLPDVSLMSLAEPRFPNLFLLSPARTRVARVFINWLKDNQNGMKVSSFYLQLLNNNIQQQYSSIVMGKPR